MKKFRPSRALSLIDRFDTILALLCWFGFSWDLEAQLLAPLKPVESLEWHTREQIRLLHEEKLSRTPAQRKIDSQLLYSARQRAQGSVGFGLSAFKPALRLELDGRVLLDVRANVSAGLLSSIRSHGGLIISSLPRYQAVRALVPIEAIETLAQRPEVRSVRPAARATTNTQIVYEGGDIAHRAAEARNFFATDGTGVKVGVLSDSIDGLTEAQAGGALPDVTILPGQDGTGTGEGTAMLEIVHALAPGAGLYFATAFNSEASFAQNIRALKDAGCRIIIDDVTYFNESPFQDGVIAQAVNDVSAAGVLFFSAAGNSGGLDRGTSGTWEGDFKDAGPVSNIGAGGHIHDFGGTTYNTVLAGVGFERLDLMWTDPLGHSTNDYDVYVLDSSGNVVRSSTNDQNGSADPYESIDSLNVGQRIVILKYSGVPRFLHLSTGRGHLTIATAGATYGHNASGAGNAFCVAAARVPSPAAPFVGGSTNPLENFSSDGPRHVFLNVDGSQITPGDVSSTGGLVLNKPDLTAADGVYTTLQGFAPFLGTSAAAPHVGAIAALLWSFNPFLPPDAVRSLLTSTALPIGNPGFDRNSGAGIVMAYPALAAAPQVLLQSWQLLDANHNGGLDPNECADLMVTLHNSSGATVSGITATLTSITPDVFVDPTPRTLPDLQANQSTSSSIPFHLSTGPAFVCGSNALFRLEVATATLGKFRQPFGLSSVQNGVGNTNTFVSADVPMDIPDLGTAESGVQVSGLVLPLAQVRVGVSITHTYDQDLRIALVAPDDTEVVLSQNNGQSGQNYGIGCDNMTWFSDDALSSIGVASAPFVGVFTPDQPLSDFNGKSGAAANGLWRLRVSDQAAGDVGTIQCWTLELTPIGCFDGGGQCLAPPQFTQDLSDQVAPNGSTVNFNVIVSGTAPFAYQWLFNGMPLDRQTNATLQLANVGPAQAGTYQVVVTNVYGTNTSAVANLTIVAPPAVVVSPPSQFVTNGNTVTWTAQAQGTGPLSYQWYFNVTNILTGATNTTLVLPNIDPTQAGTYEAVATNLYGSVTSPPALLIVYVPPTIVCNPDTTAVLGFPWAFSPPSFADTNLIVTIQGTTTNNLCGESFSATRQWLVNDTNNYRVTCSQTVQVLATNPPILSCPANKSVVLGNNWSFDVPIGRDAAAIEALVYDNWTNNLNQLLDPGSAEVGNQITLAGSGRYPSRFALEYWGTNATQAAFAGAVTARVRFYLNDGPTVGGGGAAPGTTIYDSGPLSISATQRSALEIQEFSLSAAVPLSGPLPASFTWTVVFSGLGSGDAAGLHLYGPPVVGQSAAGYWAGGSSGWSLAGQAGQAFGGQLVALSGGVTLTVAGTVTNQLCAQSFSTTRTWQAQDACGNAASCSQTVTVQDHSKPVVVNQSQDQSALGGQNVTLSVDVSSCPPVYYQWYFNQTTALAHATNATLTLTSVALNQSGSYQVVITNDYGSVTSAPIQLTISPPPTIITNPVDQVVTNGDTVQMSVSAQGTGTLSYQWFQGNQPVSGATSPTLTLANVVPNQAGKYTAVVSDFFGSVTSAPARLQVLVLPASFSIQSAFAIPDPGSVISPLTASGMQLPLGRVVVGVHITHPFDNDLTISLMGPDGTTVVLSTNNGQSGQDYGTDCNNMTFFSDSAANPIQLGSAPFAGQYKPQQALSAFVGKSGSKVNGVWKLQVDDDSPGDAGTLECWSLELDPIGCLAGGGPCFTPPEITQDISDQVLTNGDTLQLSVAAQGGDPISYQWYFNSTQALARGTNATLTVPNIDSAQAGTYRVVVSNLFGRATSATAHITVITPARILTGPTDQVATNGDTVKWMVVAQGDQPLSYQWLFNSAPLAGATNSTLMIANVNPLQAGTYQVVVSNGYASTVSSPAHLSVVPQIFCSSDTQVALGTPWSFTPPSFYDTNLILAVLSTITNGLCGQTFSATRQWLVSDTNGYQLTCSQTVQVLATNGPTLTCAADKSVALGDNWTFDVPLARDSTATEALVFDSLANGLGNSLDSGSLELGNQITLDGTERYPSSFALEYWGTNASQTRFVGAVTATVRFYQNDGPSLPTGEATPGTLLYNSGPINITATNTGLLLLDEFQVSAAVPVAAALPSSFTWTISFSGLDPSDAAGLNFHGAPAVGQVSNGYWAHDKTGWTLQGQAGQSFGAQLKAFSRGVNLSVLSTVTNAPCARTLNVTRTWQALDVCGNPAVCSQSVTVQDQAGPVVLSQPQSQSALAGQTVTLSVGISSCPPTAFQWYFNDDSNPLIGETNSNLVLANIGAGGDGSYFAIITNAYGSTTSASAVVSVHVPATVVGGLGDQTATNGDDVHFRVLAKGTPTLAYQWYFNITNALPNQTDATLDLTNVGPAQAGSYDVVVTNLYGSTTSVPVNLAIVTAPTIVTDIADQTATNGDDVSWTITAQGTAPLSYQWYFNNTVLGVETNASLVLSNVVSSEAGIYQVIVANLYGSITSSPANLKVVVVPRVTCSPNISVTFGSHWDFSPPSVGDTNVLIQVLSTLTNALCGNSFSATRQWLVTDTNGFQVPCSQTVQVLDTTPPVITCPTNKNVPYGTAWDFDVPHARPAEAVEALVYDNWTNNLNQPLDSQQLELGNQIVTDGAEHYPSRFSLEYWATNANQGPLASTATARVKFYLNDGPTLPSGDATPGTVVYDSGAMPISGTQKGALLLQNFSLNAAIPLQGALPASFTWTVRFNGLGSQDSAGLNLYGPTVVGQAVKGYWQLGSSGWTLQGQAGQGFGGQLAALSSVATITLVNTVTNAVCARTFTAKRTWQATDNCGNASSCSQTVTVTDQSPPVLLSQSQDQSALVGQTVSLSVNVSSCPPISYQWYFNQTNPLAQATSATLVLNNVDPTQAGSYEAVIANGFGSITSAPINLHISGAPSIITQPQDLVVSTGSNAIFSVSATGLPAPSYQWLFNDTNAVAGGTSNILTLLSVQTNQAGFYSVLVSNSVGKVTSTKAKLSVVDAPTITLQPQSYTVLQGTDVVFSVTAVGTAPLSYQWLANCTRPISGATSPTLRLKNVGPLDSGTYCVTISNTLGVVSSQPAALRVLVQPKLTSLIQNQNGIALSFATVTNLLYSVYSSPSLPPTNWTILPGFSQVPGTGSPMTVHDPNATGPQGSYKIVVQ